MSADATSAVRDALAFARQRLGADQHRAVDRIERGLDGPLRVAVAGIVNAGKSTLVNTLIGEPLALTDATESTRLVTTYRDGATYDITATRSDGTEEAVPFLRDRSGLHLDLGGVGDVVALDVRVPSQRLRDIQLVDTPGLGSPSLELQERTRSFLARDPANPGVDAVLYLLRHRHPSGEAFLADFHGGMDAGSSTGVIGVLSRADEAGGAGPDAMEVAAEIATESGADPRVASMCSDVMPVAALLAQGASQLREGDVADLQAAARTDAGDLLSVDRFIGGGGREEVDARRGLVIMLGWHGVRRAIGLLAEGEVDDAAGLAMALESASGVPALRAALDRRFAGRRRVLKAGAALAALRRLAAGNAEVVAAVEAAELNAHELVEVAVVDRLRSGDHELEAPLVAPLLRLLGAEGASAQTRLGLDTSVSEATVAAEAAAAAGRWRQHATDPFVSPGSAALLQAAVRTAEGLAAASAG